MEGQNPTIALPPVYKAKDYSRLLGMQGISDNTLKTHFKLYEGYVTNTNDKLGKIREMLSQGKERSVECQELRRRLGWEFDGMRLHEYYFDNLGGDGQLNSSTQLYKQISQDFGSFDLWKKDFVSTGMMRGIGWAALYYDPVNGKIFNM
jgi:Fe-Mn family superoxide dismutase